MKSHHTLAISASTISVPKPCIYCRGEPMPWGCLGSWRCADLSAVPPASILYCAVNRRHMARITDLVGADPVRARGWAPGFDAGLLAPEGRGAGPGEEGSCGLVVLLG
jgi:hypothetical protein